MIWRPLTGGVFVAALHIDILVVAAEAVTVFNFHKETRHQFGLIPTAAASHAPDPNGLLHAGFRHGIRAGDHVSTTVVAVLPASHSTMTRQ